jgi:transcriptional regulator with XRE-family HTH domain
LQVSKPPEVTPVAARVRLRVDQFRKYAGLKWQGQSDEAKARAIGIDPATYSRVVNGKQAPGERFIASLLAALPELDFADLFEVVDDEQVPA